MFLSNMFNLVHLLSSHILNEADPSKLKHNRRQCAPRRTVGWGSSSKIVTVPESLLRSSKCIHCLSCWLPIAEEASPSMFCSTKWHGKDKFSHNFYLYFSTYKLCLSFTNVQGQSCDWTNNMLCISVTVSKKNPLRILFCLELAFWEQF